MPLASALSTSPLTVLARGERPRQAIEAAPPAPLLAIATMPDWREVMNTNTVETHDASHRFTKRILLSAPILLALVALGCGEQKQQTRADLATTRSGVADLPASTAPETKAVVASTGELAAVTQAAETDGAVDGSLPPDIVAAGPETVALPGTVVTIAAVGSSDVTSVMLTDRAGEKTPFTYDSEANMWRAAYRVPLRADTEKLALSVTASTDANRWKRVWVFLRLREEGAKPAEAAPDSTQ